MRLRCRALLIFGLLAGFFWIDSSFAQNPPKVEVFGGFSYFRTGEDVPDPDLLGFEASVALNANSWVGLVADFGWYFDGLSLSIPGIAGDFDSDVQTYLFGPRFTARASRIQPFVEVLFGGARADVSAAGFKASDSTFAAAFGGGLDYASGHFGWRIIQGDYLVTTFGDETQNAFRLSSGLLIRF